MSFKRPQSPNKTLHNLELNMAIIFCPIGIPVSYLFSTVTTLEKQKKERKGKKERKRKANVSDKKRILKGF